MDWTFCELQHPQVWGSPRFLSAVCKCAFHRWKSDFPASGVAQGKWASLSQPAGTKPSAGFDNVCGFRVCFRFNGKHSWSLNLCMNKYFVEMAAGAGGEGGHALHLGQGEAVSAFEK